MTNSKELSKGLQDKFKEIIGSYVNADKARELVDAVFEAVAEDMAKGETVSIQGFGVFATRTLKARKGRNPSTGDEIDIPEGTFPTFEAKRALKDKVNG